MKLDTTTNKTTLKTLYFILTTIIGLYLSSNCYSQKLFVKISSKDSLENTILEKINYTKNKSSKEEVNKALTLIENELNRLGFINHTIISQKKIDSSYFVNYKLNNQLEYIRINISKNSIIRDFLKTTNQHLKNGSILIPFKSISYFLKTATNHFSETGYSFTKITLKNFSIKNNSAIADLNIKINLQRKIDGLIINGFHNFPKKLLNSKYGKNKKIFNNEYLKELSQKINTIPFVENIKSPQVLFLKDSTLIYIYLKKKTVNQFDGVVGFTSDKNSKLVFNGNLNLNLYNTFNQGEQVNLQWKSTESLNKQLNLSLNVPYIFNSKLSPDFNFSLFSQDSSFINLQSKTILNYQLNYKNKIGVILITEKSTSLLKTNSNTIKNYNAFFYGLNYNYTTVSDEVFYKNKFLINLNLLNGLSKMEHTNYSKNKIVLNIDYLLKLNKKNKILIKSNTSLLYSDKYLNNELDRIGGLNTIRGFKSNSIPASKYSTFNIEYSFHTNNKTALYTITDYAYTINDLTNNKNSLFGLGFGFKTKLKSSLLNLSYSTGIIKNQPLNFNKATINIQYLSFF